MRTARIRLIAFLPLAVLIACGVVLFASSIVSALERTFVPGPSPAPAAVSVVEFRRVDFECDPVSRTMRSLSHAMMGCDVESGCRSSAFVCPDSSPESIELERDESHPKTFLF
jgi:hypothetical protein